MPERVVLTCSKCGHDIEEDPMLGDKQGAIREIVHGGTTWRITLCTKCAEPLWELYWDYVDVVKPGGTAYGPEVLKYLPRVVDEVNPLQRASSAGDARVVDEQDGKAVNPPQFSGEG